MEAFMEEFQHLKIQLEEIKSATGDFHNDNVIGIGGFGKVYGGEISHSKGRSMVALKRLNRNYGQGDPEFLKEILMLSHYTHENLISLLGFCDQDGEKILVYEHASHGSLDRHLSSANLTWMQRLKICLAAATGLCFLHDPKQTQQRVIHRDIKSSNILLDENWNAKISDLGLSKIGPANQQHTFLATNVVGTFGYVDPTYVEKSILTKESDVYSFGVVLFEVLCGKLCFENSNGNLQSLVPKWKKSYKQNKLDEIIFNDMKQDMDPGSLETFSDIAYQCLHKSREERPTMYEVVEKLEIVLGVQEFSEDTFIEVEQRIDYEEMIKTVVPPLVYKSEEELKMLLSKGILVDGGKTWFWLNKHGEHCELISAAECLIPIDFIHPEDANYNQYTSRFDVEYYQPCTKFKTHVRTQFLSPHITYTVNLVFSFYDTSKDFLYLHYKLAREAEYSISYITDKREDGWLMAELYQFTSDTRNVDLEIMFVNGHQLVVEGIEFQPLEHYNVEGEVLVEEEVDTLTISDSDLYWEQKLPSDYEDIIKWSKDSLQWITKKELYSIMCKGFPIYDGEEWFSITKNGKTCHMLSARMALGIRDWNWWPSPESRFGEVAVAPHRTRTFVIIGLSSMLSTQTTYAIYLIYKLQGDLSGFEPPVKVTISDRVLIEGSYEKNYSWYIYLVSPRTPIIKRKAYHNTHNPLNRPKVDGLPQKRNDGWMEVQIWEFQTGIHNRWIQTCFQLTFLTHLSREGLIVEGIEFRPI